MNSSLRINSCISFTLSTSLQGRSSLETGAVGGEALGGVTTAAGSPPERGEEKGRELQTLISATGCEV